MSATREVSDTASSDGCATSPTFPGIDISVRPLVSCKCAGRQFQSRAGDWFWGQVWVIPGLLSEPQGEDTKRARTGLGCRKTRREARSFHPPIHGQSSMVRRGSTVRVRQRALQRPRKTGSFVFGPAYTPPARSGVESVLENRVLRRIPSRHLMIVSGGTRARGSRRLRTSSRGRAAAPGSLLSG
jgi:hypothetical protein